MRRLALEAEARVGSCGAWLRPALVGGQGEGWMPRALCCDVGRGDCGKLSALREPVRSATVGVR